MMMKERAMTDKSQLEKFKELAREADCDPSEKKFDQALKKVSKTRREPKTETEKEQK